MSRLILVGPLPPPYYGQSVSFRMLVDEVARLGVPHAVVNLGHGEGSGEKIGIVTRHRVADYAAILRRFLAVAARGPRGTVYLTIAQSRAGFLRDWVMIRAARLFGHRVVLHLKGGNYDHFYAAQPGWLRDRIRATLRRADRVLVLGEALRGMFDFEPALAPRIRVVPNGLPDEREPGGAAKALPARGEGPVRLLFLSNLVESKGWLDVLEAVRLLRGRLGEGRVRCDFHGAFYTSADDVRVTSPEQARELFDRFVAEHGLEDAVRYGGVAKGEEKRRVLEEAHLFLLPTRYNNEGQPVSIIEAMAHGCVVVSTDYRAIPDLVDDGVTGVLVPYGAPEAIAGAVEALARDPERYARMSGAAVERFRARFTRRGHLDTILPHLLEEIVPPAGAAEGPAARAAAGLAHPRAGGRRA